MAPGELFDPDNGQFEPHPFCWKCGAPVGEEHDLFCSFDFCRRSGVVRFGDRTCYCYKGPQYNYINGRLIGEYPDAGRVDPPGSLVTAVSTPIDQGEDEEEFEGSRRTCQFDVPWDGYAPDTLACKALGLLIRRRVALNRVTHEPVDDPDMNGVMPDLRMSMYLQDAGMLEWNSLLLRWQWSARITSLENSARALAQCALLSVKGRGAPREDAPKAMHILHRLATSGHASSISAVLAFFKGEEKPWFYGGFGKIFKAAKEHKRKTQTREDAIREHCLQRAAELRGQERSRGEP